MDEIWPYLALGLAAGIALGFLFAHLLQRSRQRQTSETLAELRRLIDQGMEKLPAQFQQLSAQALRDASAELRAQDEHTQKSQRELYEERQNQLDALVKPIQESLEKMRTSHTQLSTRMEDLRAVTRNLQDETGNLVTALRRPEVRGRWGELQLRRVVELAGMQAHVDFQEQVQEAQNARRPDLIVQLPNERQIVVDAKTPLDAYLQAYEAEYESARQDHLRRHAEQVKQSFLQLASKGYWNSLEERPDFVVMFIPGEVFYSAALQEMPELIEQSARHNVLIATPTILIALLRAIQLGWQERQLAERAREIGAHADELHQRAGVLLQYIGDIGRGLDRAVRSYNQTVGSLEARYLPHLRQIERLKSSKEELPALTPLERQTRSLSPQPDLPLDEGR